MSLGALIEAVVSSTSLRKIIEVGCATVEDVAPLAADSWMRASSLPNICPREEVFVSINKLVRKREIDGDTFVNFAVGKGIHSELQNSILPLTDVLLGEWECSRCGAHYGIQKPGQRVSEYAIKRPIGCIRCEDPNQTFRFHEYSLTNSQYKLTGHPDGILSIPGITGLGVLEAKSISPKGGWEVAHTPKLDHALQAHIYMWMLDLTWAKILYWDKGIYGLAGIIEHTIERDDDTIEALKGVLTELWDGLRLQRPPTSRICAHAEAPRAKGCVAVIPCFAEEIPNADDQ
jgi:hypothetical protein